MNREERDFWERTFLTALAALADKKNAAQKAAHLADSALEEWKARLPEAVTTQQQLNFIPSMR